MRILDSYFIKRNTIVIIPVYYKNGELYSIVLQGDEPILVLMSPSMIIELSLLHYGSSIQGACTGSRSVLGNIKMIPLRISGELEIYWFPCSSPSKGDCVWFSQAHVKDKMPKGLDQTYVYLTSGHRITVDMKKKCFDRKFEKATVLRYIQSERNKFSESDNYESLSGFQIWKDPNNPYHYDIKGLEWVHEMEATYLH